MADAFPQKGKDTIRQSTADVLTKRREEMEQEKSKNLFREQIIFVLIAVISVAPLVAAFMVKDTKVSYMLFKIGGATLILLYPCYLLIRSIISSALKGPKTK